MSERQGGYALAIVVMVAAALLMGLLAWRTYLSIQTGKRICEVVSEKIHEDDVLLDHVDYFQAHPAERDRLRANYRHALDRLDCSSYPPVNP